MSPTMSFRQFVWQAFRRSFHRAWFLVHSAEVVIAIGLYVASLFFHETKEYLGVAFVALLIVASLTLLAGWFLSAYRFYYEADKERQRLSEHPPELLKERDLLRAQLDANYAAHIQLFHQGGSLNGRFAVAEHVQTLYVEQDGLLRGNKKVTFKAIERVSMVESHHEGDSHIDYTDLNVIPEGDQSHGVVVLPAGQTPTAKTLLLAFLPDVAADSIASYQLSWQWPKLWEHFFTHPADSFRHEVDSATPIPVMRFKFRLAKGLPQIKLTNIGEGGGQQIALADPLAADGYTDYVWEMKNVKDGARIDIRLEKW